MDLPSNTSRDCEVLLRYWNRVLYMKRPMMKSTGAGQDKREEGVDSKEFMREVGDERTNHDKLAVGHVEHPGDSVLQVEPHGNEGINASHD